MYGKELVIDLHESKITPISREVLEKYFIELCDLIDMHREDLHFWDYSPEEYEKAPPHLKGVTAIQFISTSDIRIHALDDLKCVFINIFSCKDFESDVVELFTEEYFKGRIVRSHEIERI